MLGLAAHPDMVLNGRHGASKHRLVLAGIEVEGLFFEEEVSRLVFTRRALGDAPTQYAVFIVPTVDMRRRKETKKQGPRKRYIDGLRHAIAGALNEGIADVRINEESVSLELVLKDGRMLVVSSGAVNVRALRLKMAGDIAIIGASA